MPNPVQSNFRSLNLSDIIQKYLFTASAFFRPVTPCIIEQDAPYDRRRKREIPDAVLKIYGMPVNQFQIGFVNERGLLERQVFAFAL